MLCYTQFPFSFWFLCLFVFFLHFYLVKLEFFFSFRFLKEIRIVFKSEDQVGKISKALCKIIKETAV